MKFYIAAKFEKKSIVLELYKQLRAAGHTVAYDWTTHKGIKPYIENKDLAREYSTNEINGIADSDVFIYLTDDSGHTLHMEYGAAIMHRMKTGKPLVYAVGEFNDKSPWFFNEFVKRKDSVAEVIEEVLRM